MSTFFNSTVTISGPGDDVSAAYQSLASMVEAHYKAVGDTNSVEADPVAGANGEATISLAFGGNDLSADDWAKATVDKYQNVTIRIDCTSNFGSVRRLVDKSGERTVMELSEEYGPDEFEMYADAVLAEKPPPGIFQVSIDRLLSYYKDLLESDIPHFKSSGDDDEDEEAFEEWSEDAWDWMNEQDQVEVCSAVLLCRLLGSLSIRGHATDLNKKIPATTLKRVKKLIEYAVIMELVADDDEGNTELGACQAWIESELLKNATKRKKPGKTTGRTTDKPVLR